MRPRILIAEEIHPDGTEALREVATVDLMLGRTHKQLAACIAAYDGLVVKSVTQVDAVLLDAASRLRIVGRAGTGTENIDLDAAAERGVSVLTVPTGNTVSAAEFTVAMLLSLSRRLPEAARAVARGDFRRHLLEGREVAGLAVGLVGLGNVGMAVAERLRPFGCRLIGWDPKPGDAARFAALGGVLTTSFDDLLPRIDVLSLHVRLTPETRGMVDATALARTRRGLLLINTARGPVIDDNALLAALDNGQVAAAALDVLDPEPPLDVVTDVAFTHPLLGHDRVLVTPHMAASTEDAQRRIAVDLAQRMADLLTATAVPPATTPVLLG